MTSKIDIMKAKIFPNNVIVGIATGYSEMKTSYFSTEKYNENDILKARVKLEDYFKDCFSKFFYQNQIHSDIINDLSKIDAQIESDAIVCNESGILLNVSIADCQSILVYDAVNQVIVAIHSGWKGTKLNIVTKAIKRLKVDYNTNPSDLLIFLPPSASVQNYEVGEEFMDLFPKSTISIDGKYYFDNRKEIINQLLDSGIKIINIESLNECTISNNRFHSYRRDKAQSGRMSAFIGIKKV